MKKIQVISASMLGCIQAWTHGWNNLYEAQFIDFTSNSLFSQDQAEFVATHYQIVSMEKCTGQSSGLKTEEAIWQTANQLKAVNPDVKVMFYISTDNQGLNCYAAYDEFMANPSWWLTDDSGNYVNNTQNIPEIDFRVANATNWWVNIPFNGSVANTNINGVLADGTNGRCPTGLNTTNCDSYRAAKDLAVQTLQGMFDSNHTGGEVIGNGIFMYTGTGFPSDYGLGVLDYSAGVMVEHVAVFECVSGDSLNIPRMETLFPRFPRPSQPIRQSL